MATISPIFDAGATIFLELAFTDRNGAAVTPTALTMQVIDKTNGQVVYPTTSVTPPVSPQSTLEVTIPASVNQMTRATAKQCNVVIISATYPDGSITPSHFPYELCNPSLLLVKASPRTQ